MGFFNKSDKSAQQRSSVTVIAEGTNIIGGISTKGRIHIDGKFEGIILEADTVSIGITGKIIGDIKANIVITNGLIDGKINCNEIQILKTGKVIGEIEYSKFTIEEHGEFEGNGIKKNSTLRSKYTNIERKITDIAEQANKANMNLDNNKLSSSLNKSNILQTNIIKNEFNNYSITLSKK